MTTGIMNTGTGLTHQNSIVWFTITNVEWINLTPKKQWWYFSDIFRDKWGEQTNKGGEQTNSYDNERSIFLVST